MSTSRPATTRSDSRWPVPVLLLSATALLLLLLTAFLTPVSNDAGTYLTIADAILKGDLPYRDFFDHKGPGIYYLLAVVLAIGGRALAAVQTVQAMAVVATAATAAWLAWRLWGGLAGGLALFLALYGGAAFAGAHVTTEAWVALLTAAALFVLLRGWPQSLPETRDWLVAGLLVGLSALFKQTGAATLLAFVAWATLLPGSRSLRLRRWFWLFLGTAAPLLIVAAYFLFRGALADLWRDAVMVNLLHYAPQRFGALLRGHLVNLRSFPLLWLGLLVGVITRPSAPYSSSAAAKGDAATLLWLTLAASLLPLLHHSFSHYLLQALPAAAVLTGAGLAKGWDCLTGSGWAVKLAVIVAAAAIALVDLPAWPGHLRYTGELVQRQAAVAAYVRAQTAQDEPILAITAAPQFYFLSNRPPASRWLYLYPVNFSPAREAALVSLVRDGDVAIVVVDDRDAVAWHGRLRQAVIDSCDPAADFGVDLHVFRCQP